MLKFVCRAEHYALQQREEKEELKLPDKLHSYLHQYIYLEFLVHFIDSVFIIFIDQKHTGNVIVSCILYTECNQFTDIRFITQADCFQSIETYSNDK